MALESNLCPPYLASLDFRRRGEGAKKKSEKKRRRGEEGGEEKKAKGRKKERKKRKQMKRKRGKAENCGEGGSGREPSRPKWWPICKRAS